MFFMMCLCESGLHFQIFGGSFYSSFKIDVLSLFVSTLKAEAMFSSEITVSRPTSMRSNIRKYHRRYNGISVKT